MTSPAITSFLHDPADLLDYTTTVVGLAASEVVASATAVGPAGITVAPSGKATTHDDTTVTVWVTGGVLGEVYDVVVHVVTNQGREADQTLRFRCVQR